MGVRRNCTGRSRIAIVFALVLTHGVARSQTVPLARLGPVTGRSPEELGPYGMRELSDGRLLVSESGPNSRLLVIDFANGTATPISRKGRGPGEFEFASGLYALGGDSTILNAGMKRWLVLDGTRIVATSRPDDPATLPGSGPRGADRLGNITTTLPGRWQDDSVVVVLVSRANGNVVQIAKLAMEFERGYPPRPTQSGNRVTYARGAWVTYEQYHLFPDGWIAIARLNPYRIDWRAPDGRWTLGAPLPVPLVRVTDREKQSYMDRLAQRTGAAVKAPDTYTAWPKSIPPFSFRVLGLVATPEGRLLVPRTQTADHPEMRYDVINRAGKLERQIVLQPNESIHYVGIKSAYVMVTDDDGIRRIERRAWP
jgi:hypothetical protein